MLNDKQKDLLRKFYRANKQHVGIAFDMYDCNRFSRELHSKLIEMNDYETLWQDINRFLSDLAAEDMFEAKGFTNTNSW